MMKQKNLLNLLELRYDPQPRPCSQGKKEYVHIPSEHLYLGSQSEMRGCTKVYI